MVRIRFVHRGVSVEIETEELGMIEVDMCKACDAIDNHLGSHEKRHDLVDESVMSEPLKTFVKRNGITTNNELSKAMPDNIVHDSHLARAIKEEIQAYLRYKAFLP